MGHGTNDSQERFFDRYKESQSEEKHVPRAKGSIANEKLALMKSANVEHK